MVKSFSWQSVNVVTQIVLQLGFIAIMARLLDPEDFGVLSIALVVVGFIEIFSQIGIGPALIQRKDLRPGQINGAFHISIILGLSFFALLYFTAPWIANLFEHEPLKDILRVIGLSFIISAVSIVPKSLIIKSLEFKKLFIAAVFAMVIGNFGVGVTLAYFDFKIWAYVYALLAQNLIMTIFYWVQHPVSISRKWRFNETRDMLRYGFGSTLFNFFNYAASKIDVIVVGRLGGDLNQNLESSDNRWANTGVYDRSVYLNSLPITVLGKLSDSVMFSGLSQIQDQKEKLQRTFLTGTYFISVLVIPASIFLILFAEEVVLSFYGKKFAAAVPVVQILFISVALRSLIKLCDAVVRALDAVYQSSLIKFFFFLLVGVGSYFGLENGLEGVAIAIVLAVFIQYILMHLLTMKLIGLSLIHAWGRMVPGVLLGIVVLLTSFPIRYLIDTVDLGPLVGLVVAICSQLFVLLILAWNMPWVFGKGKDNLLTFALQKLPNWSFLNPIKRKLDSKD